MPSKCLVYDVTHLHLFISIVFSSPPPPSHFYCFPSTTTPTTTATFLLFSLHHHHHHHGFIFIETINMNKSTRHIMQNVATIIKSLIIHSIIANYKDLSKSIISFLLVSQPFLLFKPCAFYRQTIKKRAKN